MIKMYSLKKSHLCIIYLMLHTAVSLTHEDKVPNMDQSSNTVSNSSKEETVNAWEDKESDLLENDYFLKKLMLRYGNGTVIFFEGFEHLLQHLDLGGIMQFDHATEFHKSINTSEFQLFHVFHNHSDNADQSKLVNENVKNNYYDHTEHTEDLVQKGEDDPSHVHLGDLDKRDAKETFSECLPAKVMVRMIQSDEDNVITKAMFKDLCPSLIYQIDAGACSDNQPIDRKHLDDDHSGHSNVPYARTAWDITKVPLKVWAFSVVTVLIISLVGLLGVAVIPIMQKVFYNHLLQFLVTMAVGALSGDAMLHLLPHAFSSGGHENETGGQDGHGNESVYKGLCGLLGIYFFFFTERIVTIVTQMKQSRKQSKLNHGLHKMDEKLSQIGRKLACNEMECDEMVMSIHPDRALQGYVDQTHSEHCGVSFENSKAVSHDHHEAHQIAYNNHNHSSMDEAEQETMLSHNTPMAKGHGHSHSHGQVPNSVSSVAWMVILGDGIHNFSDGLAIGAAFASSITGGISTSIAVFCHELPHEIGDFAMLLRAGMAIKQAIFYNLVSSFLCILGMLIGVAIGNISSASQWVFAAVGGIFLYIALVDMLPEVSSVDTKKGEHPFCHLLLQLLGMFVGGGIMLVIAIYEQDLKNLLE